MHDPRLAAIRIEYETAGLDVDDVHPDPLDQFEHWFADALAAGLDEPNAMVLATAGEDGPSARAVLLKGFDRDGFVFFSNYESRKAEALNEDHRASLLFLWLPLHRQLRIEGMVGRVSETESDSYYATRPRDAKLGAQVSPQSRVIPDRAWLEDRMAEMERRFEGIEPPRPGHWGGYRVRPDRFEFWQGRPGRLHDRIRYRLVGQAWVIERLAP